MNTELEESRRYWDQRAETFGGRCGGKPGRNRYAERFLELLDAPAGATVLDMGCATGTLAVPLAERGCEVVVCDFSPRMIEKLEGTASEEDLPIACKLMAWEDDWRSFGVGEKSVDIAVASQSLGYREVRHLLEKLDATARMELARMVGPDPMDDRERELFDRYAQGHFKEESGEDGVMYQLDYKLIAPWAFIMWSTRGEI